MCNYGPPHFPGHCPLPRYDDDERIIDDLIRRVQARRCRCGRDKAPDAVDCSEEWELIENIDMPNPIRWMCSWWRRTSPDAGADRGGEE